MKMMVGKYIIRQILKHNDNKALNLGRPAFDKLYSILGKIYGQSNALTLFVYYDQLIKKHR